MLQKAGGGYLVRVGGLLITVVCLGGSVGSSWLSAGIRDRAAIGGRQRRRFLRNLRRQKLLSWWSVRRLLRYLRPGFHPDDMETDHLVNEWRTRLADQVTETKAHRQPA